MPRVLPLLAETGPDGVAMKAHMSQPRTQYGFGFELPLRTQTENNNNEHWRKRWQRAKLQRTTVCQYLWMLYRAGYRIQLPALVTLIRVAPRQLDHIDNLSSAGKHIRDGIADFFCLDDRTDQLAWHYAQMRGKPNYYGIRIVLEPQKENPI